MDVGSLSCGYYQIKLPYWTDCGKPKTSKHLYSHRIGEFFDCKLSQVGAKIRCGDLQSKMLFPTVLDLGSSTVESVFDCLLSGVLLNRFEHIAGSSYAPLF